MYTYAYKYERAHAKARHTPHLSPELHVLDALVPPTATTDPFSSVVSVSPALAKFILPVGVHAPLTALNSSAVLVAI